MSEIEQLDENKPWYRHPMVWMIMLLPFSVVVASIFTIKIALDNAPVIVDKTPVTTAPAAEMTAEGESNSSVVVP